MAPSITWDSSTVANSVWLELLLKLLNPLKKLATAAQGEKDVNNDGPCGEIPRVMEHVVACRDMYHEFYPDNLEEVSTETQIAPCRMGLTPPNLDYQVCGKLCSFNIREDARER